MKVDRKIRAGLCLFSALMFLVECKAAQMVNGPRQKVIKVQQEKQLGTTTVKVAGPKIVFESKVHDFGNLGIKEKAECEFKFKNTGQSLLKIGKIKSTCGCTAISLSMPKFVSL